MALSDRTIQGAKPKTLKNHDGTTRLADDWLSDGGARGAGRLYLRVQPSGRKSFFFRCVGPSGERQALPLGDPRKGPVVLGSVADASTVERCNALIDDALARRPGLLLHLSGDLPTIELSRLLNEIL